MNSILSSGKTQNPTGTRLLHYEFSIQTASIGLYLDIPVLDSHETGNILKVKYFSNISHPSHCQNMD